MNTEHTSVNNDEIKIYFIQFAIFHDVRLGAGRLIDGFDYSLRIKFVCFKPFGYDFTVNSPNSMYR